MKEVEKLRKAMQIADEQMKKDNGHYYVMILKTKCQFCGRSENQKGRCSEWFQTFIARLEEVYLNREDYPNLTTNQ